MKCYVFDLDGTLANCEHRLHFIQGETKDWTSFFAACKDDEPIITMISLFNDIKAPKLIVSGRSNECRSLTTQWLYDHQLPYVDLYMRKVGDHRPDHVVKLELLKQMKTDGWEPILFIDDRKQVVDMWRAQGYVCLQCAPGDF